MSVMILTMQKTFFFLVVIEFWSVRRNQGLAVTRGELQHLQFQFTFGGLVFVWEAWPGGLLPLGGLWLLGMCGGR